MQKIIYDLATIFKRTKKLKDLLPSADYRYFSFQIWQEGLAKYTEYNFLEILANYTPLKEILSLPDFVSFTALKAKMYHDETENLHKNKLNESKRASFYSIGFAEGIVLDRLNKPWRNKYMTDKSYLEYYSKKHKDFFSN